MSERSRSISVFVPLPPRASWPWHDAHCAAKVLPPRPTDAMSKERRAVISTGHGEDDDPGGASAQPAICANTNGAEAAKLTSTIKGKLRQFIAPLFPRTGSPNCPFET